MFHIKIRLFDANIQQINELAKIITTKKKGTLFRIPFDNFVYPYKLRTSSQEC